MGSIQLQSKSALPTQWGEAQIHTYSTTEGDRMPIVALLFGELSNTVNLRMHSECFTGDLLGSQKCDCGDQLAFSLDYISKNTGVLLYLRQEGRGIGLTNKIKAYALQERGANTIEANHQLGFETDLRTYEDAATILDLLNVKEVNLLSNNPLKRSGLEDCGITVCDMVPVITAPNSSNQDYLSIKKNVLGHSL